VQLFAKAWRTYPFRVRHMNVMVVTSSGISVVYDVDFLACLAASL
jgi:hypothetical protein